MPGQTVPLIHVTPSSDIATNIVPAFNRFGVYDPELISSLYTATQVNVPCDIELLNTNIDQMIPYGTDYSLFVMQGNEIHYHSRGAINYFNVTNHFCCISTKPISNDIINSISNNIDRYARLNNSTHYDLELIAYAIKNKLDQSTPDHNATILVTPRPIRNSENIEIYGVFHNNPDFAEDFTRTLASQEWLAEQAIARNHPGF
jgi:hypothetical protein